MKLAVVIVPALVWSGTARADEPPPVRALLADPASLVTWLRDHDPIVESVRARTEAAAALGQQARVFPNPQIQAGVGGFAVGGGNTGSPGTTGPIAIFSVADSTMPEPATLCRYGASVGCTTGEAAGIGRLPLITVKIATHSPITARMGSP